MGTEVGTSFSTAALSRVTGITPRTLRKWHHKGIAPASLARGAKNTDVLSYSEEQAAAVLVLVDLHARGMDWHTVRRVAAFLPRPLTRYRYLIADTKLIVGRDSDAETIAAVCSLTNLALVIETEDIMSRVRK